jgi:hypothetical protein
VKFYFLHGTESLWQSIFVVHLGFGRVLYKIGGRAECEEQTMDIPILATFFDPGISLDDLQGRPGESAPTKGAGQRPGMLFNARSVLGQGTSIGEGGNGGRYLMQTVLI